MSPLPVGSVLKNRYRISKVIYQSKLSSVYIVEDTHLVGNVWAVKEMRLLALDSIDRRQVVAQFEQEVMKMTELSHPNIARIIDFFVEGQNLYIIREFIPAYDIQTLMARTTGHLSEREVLLWGIQLADALNYLYKKKFPAVFYRELELGNILVTSEGVIKIIDLGLARIFQTETSNKQLEKMGSQDYSPPEQFDEHGLFDQRSLVYSLGAILYHILTRQVPSQTPFNLPPIETLNTNVSRATRAIVTKATNNDPQWRYQALLDMKKDLANALKNPDLNFELPSTSESSSSKSLNWNLVLLIIVLLLTGGILFLIYKIFF